MYGLGVYDRVTMNVKELIVQLQARSSLTNSLQKFNSNLNMCTKFWKTNMHLLLTRDVTLERRFGQIPPNAR